MSNTLVLVVEDDKSIINLMTVTLEAHKYNFLNASTAAQALQLSASENLGLILLDLGLPDGDGVDVIKRVRSWSNVPIIVISARGSDKDKIAALDAGADDYLTKPFSVDELLARIRASERRFAEISAQHQASSSWENGDIFIDFAAGNVRVRGEEIHLTPIEYQLLVLLAHNVGRVLTHTFITEEIWGSDLESDVASLRVHMATLRKKIEDNPSNPEYIHTHVGVGYRMVQSEN